MLCQRGVSCSLFYIRSTRKHNSRFLATYNYSMFESLPSSIANSSKLTEMDNDILIFDTIKEGNMIANVQNELSNRSTQRDENENKMKAVLIP
jgi:hypothetical protein